MPEFEIDSKAEKFSDCNLKVAFWNGLWPLGLRPSAFGLWFWLLSMTEKPKPNTKDQRSKADSI